MYDESSESVLDVLLRMFDDGNDSVESNLNKVEIPSIGNCTQRNETAVCQRRKMVNIRASQPGHFDQPVNRGY